MFFFQHFLEKDHLWLFGSRVDEEKKGGDIDLYVETLCNSMDQVVEKKIDFLVDLKMLLGDQKIDVVVNAVDLFDNQDIFEEAKSTGVMIV